MIWVLWALSLIAQQASQTASSRTRAGNNVKAHAVAAFFSNGVWVVNQFVGVDLFLKHRGEPILLAELGIFYVFFTVFGSVAMHYLMIEVEEKKKARIA